VDRRAAVLIPQDIMLLLLSIRAFVVVILGWFGALGLGRLPNWCVPLLTNYLLYSTRVNVYMRLLTDRYPPFSFDQTDYPVRIELRPGRLHRGAVFFRIILAIPASIVATVTSFGWYALSFFFWLIILITGRVPNYIFAVTAAVARYEFRYNAYFFLLTSAYPKQLFGDDVPAEADSSQATGTRPLLLDSRATVLLVVLIAVGAIAYVLEIVYTRSLTPVQPTTTYSVN
jgi:hypothetical protein